MTRRLAVQVAEAWNFGFGKAMKKVYGVSVEKTLVFRDSQKTEYYVDKNQHQKYIQGLYKLLENERFLKNFHGQAETVLEDIFTKTKIKCKQDFSKLNNQQLLKLYAEFIVPNLEQFYIRMWTVFNINGPLSDVIQEELAKTVKSPEIFSDYLLKLSSPLRPNNVLNERIDLLTLALRKPTLTKENLEHLLQKHTNKYQHIPMFDFDHQPYSFQYFEEQIKKLKNPTDELRELKGLFLQRKKNIKQLIHELKPSKKFLQLIKFLQENVILRDHRDMIRQKYNLELKKFYTEVGKRLGLDIEEVAVLTNQEIIQYLKNGFAFPKNEMSKRAKAYLLIQKSLIANIYSGNEAIQKAKSELKSNKNPLENTLTGIVGSRGKVTGKVIVVYTNKDLAKVKEGTIMVATMTRQDFVPAIRRAAALVTDEGGVICHAAIIAREFRIPCVVNTKIGTQILKDGDMVEVDANLGTIKKLK